MKSNKIKYYLKNNQWCADGIPVRSLSRIIDIEFQGMVKSDCHIYKNGNEEIRWGLIESLGPDDDIWFLLGVRFCTLMGLRKVIIKIDQNAVEYQWVTEKTMRECGGFTLYPLEIAAIESEIESFLGKSNNNENKNKIGTKNGF